MSRASLHVGDLVRHYSEGDNIGVVVAVRRRWWAFFGRVYWVDWGRGVLPVPHTHGLTLTREGCQRLYPEQELGA